MLMPVAMLMLKCNKRCILPPPNRFGIKSALHYITSTTQYAITHGFRLWIWLVKIKTSTWTCEAIHFVVFTLSFIGTRFMSCCSSCMSHNRLVSWVTNDGKFKLRIETTCVSQDQSHPAHTHKICEMYWNEIWPKTYIVRHSNSSNTSRWRDVPCMTLAKLFKLASIFLNGKIRILSLETICLPDIGENDTMM